MKRVTCFPGWRMEFYARHTPRLCQHLEEACSLMQQKVPLGGLISAQDNRTLQAANSCLKSLHVRVEANVMEQTVTAQQLQFMHEMAQANCRKSNDTDHISGEPEIAAYVTSCKSNWLDFYLPELLFSHEWIAYSPMLKGLFKHPSVPTPPRQGTCC